MSINKLALSELAQQGMQGNPNPVPGLPDIAELTKLANQFFTALPNQDVIDTVPSSAAPGGASLPTSVASLSTSASVPR